MKILFKRLATKKHWWRYYPGEQEHFCLICHKSVKDLEVSKILEKEARSSTREFDVDEYWALDELCGVLCVRKL